METPTDARHWSSHNPATGAVLGEVRLSSSAEVAAAVARAREALAPWRQLGYTGRRRLLFRWRDAIRRDCQALSRLLSEEAGKPKADAIAEVFSACEFLSHFGAHAEAMLADEPLFVPNPLLANARTFRTAVPKGVVAVISPWNYPILLTMASVVTALAAGNTVVHKPSEWTPLVGARLRELADQAGLPAGVFQVVQGAGSVGATLVESDVNHVCFTGSVATGRAVARACAERFRSVTLELGGKDPALVLPDADLDFAAEGIVWACMSNAGQTCASVERLYVLREQEAALTDRLVAKVRALGVGAWDEPGTQIGPLINEAQLAKVEAQVADAVARGARVLVGGHRLERPGTFYAPTVLAGVTREMALMQEETFGPVLPILGVESVEEMIREANDSPFGLSATVWTRDLEAGERVARRIEAGTVWVNTGLDSYGNPVTPRGGLKESGLGRVSGRAGIREMVEWKVLDINRSGRRRLLWFKQGGALDEFLAGALDMLHGESLGDRVRGALRALRNWPR